VRFPVVRISSSRKNASPFSLTAISGTDGGYLLGNISSPNFGETNFTTIARATRETFGGYAGWGGPCYESGNTSFDTTSEAKSSNESSMQYSDSVVAQIC